MAFHLPRALAPFLDKADLAPAEWAEVKRLLSLWALPPLPPDAPRPDGPYRNALDHIP